MASSPGTFPKHRAFQSAVACSIRLRGKETNF